MLDYRSEAVGVSAAPDEIEISVAAIVAYGRLLAGVGRTIRTHPAGDGGLICEDRATPERPVMWRVWPDGALSPDTPYDYAASRFVPTELPPGLARLRPAA